MEERRKKLEQMDEAARKKEEELLRISEKAKSIDFTTLGVAARSVASKPVEKVQQRLPLATPQTSKRLVLHGFRTTKAA